MATAEALMTAQEFARRPDPGGPRSWSAGGSSHDRARPRHGQICAEVVWIAPALREDHDLGHVVSNDSGVITERDPDTVRGADIAFYSYAKLPKGPLPKSYPSVSPSW